MKRTLLEITQEILNDMDSDEVNSIDDTTESVQVADIIRSTYASMLSNRDWPHTRIPIKFVASATADRPTHLKLPDNVKSLEIFNYNKVRAGETRKRYETVKYLTPDAFLRRQNQFDNDANTSDVILDETGVELIIQNNRAPEYFTSFDDTTIVCDAYDSTVESTLQNSKVQAVAYTIPAWVHEDSAIPNLPLEAFSLLIEESKSKASFKLRQVNDVKAEQEAGRQNRWLSRKARNIAGGIQYPNYGRGSRKMQRDPTFTRNN